ncbi:MAG: ZIP family magnesium transporter [Gemmatimonadetes bacterium]|nr:ZIP family magnesium transporter [Gemmatimonadota bacterium]
MTALLYAVVAAAGNIVGGLAVARGAKAGLKFIEGMLAFGAGFMLSVAIMEVLPEALARGGNLAAGYALAGYLLVHLTQHTATQHFHFGEETHSVSEIAGASALVGLLLHTFFDGVAIASGFAVSRELGILLFLAVFLHKLPEGVTISSLQIAGGKRPAQAVGSAALLGAATIVGVLVTDWVSFLSVHGLALSGGVTLYVGASNLVPEFQGKHGWYLQFAFFSGAAGFLLARELLRMAGAG